MEWFDDQPPALVEERALLADKGRLARLQVPDPAAGPRMSDRVEAVRLLRQRAGAGRIVEGWVEGPCAMSADLRGVNTLMLDFFDDPGFVRDLFAFTVEMELAVRPRADRGGCRHDRSGGRRRIADRSPALQRVRAAVRVRAGARQSRRRARGCACTFAARPGACIAGWPRPAPRSSTSIS